MRRSAVESLLRQHAKERAELLAVIAEQADRIMYLSGRPWQVAPATVHDAEADFARDEAQRERTEAARETRQRFQAVPEQHAA